MLELKLRLPTLRPGMVQRSAVLERVRAASDAQLVTVIAPAGYGKTTLMTQLLADQVFPAAWLSMDASDNDPAILLGALADALAEAGLIDDSERGRSLPASEHVLTYSVQNLIGALARSSEKGVLLLDQVDSVRSRTSRDVIGALLTSVPSHLQVILASRTTAGLPIPLLRSKGGILELTASDLAMDHHEAAELLDGLGLEVDDGIAELVERTEGWPAGIYLTALAIQAGAPMPDTVDVRGDDVFLADYLKQEVLGRLSAARFAFLIRSSILSQLSGDLCDFVLETEGSERALARLAESNLMVVPMDRTRTWYRYHSLLQDYLRSELQRREPNIARSLHSRAATWFDLNGYPELAIEHAKAAGEGERLAIMVSKAARLTYARGMMDALSGWLDWLEKSGAIGGFPELAAVGAFARSLEGDAGGADRLANLAYRGRDGEVLSDSDLGPAAMLLRSLQAPSGPEQALADARVARDGFAASVDWLHVATGAEALALIAQGAVDEADPIWATAVSASEGLEARPFTSIALAHRAVIAISRHDWDAAEELIDRAMGLIRLGGLERYITSALAFSLAARVAARRGDVEAARASMSKAAALRPRFTSTLPILSVSTLLEMTRCFIELADMAGARRVMREASDIIALRPRLGVLVTDHGELKEKLASLPAGAVGPSSLTSAELRLLPWLVTHLTYPEIGERLFVSRHTVKTQAMSIYRKLGVSSRTEAVERSRAIGLLSL